MHDRTAIRAALVDGLAEIKGVTADEVLAVLSDLGDDNLLELDSKQAEWVIAYAEFTLALAKPPPQPADLHKEQFATLGAILDTLTSALDGERGDDSE